MVAGLERYFQIARCFRDEDTRGDRQPEFTQLDLEMDFPTQEDVLSLIENLFKQLIEKIYPEKKIKQYPFPRITYKEAIEKYKSDKPDLRKDKNNSDELAFAFIVDFPLFEFKKEEKKWGAVHHPFTSPKLEKDETIEQLIERIKKDPSKPFANQYDFVLNGLDRIIMILENEPSIREVIAFPKTGDGRDLMMNAPSEVDDKQLKDLHIKTLKS